MYQGGKSSPDPEAGCNSPYRVDWSSRPIFQSSPDLEGPLATLEIVHRLGNYGVTVASFQEPWQKVSGELRDLLLAIVGWVARMESNRRSERTKAGLARSTAQGKRLGRPPGSKDKKKRSRRGYLLRWAE